MDDRELTRLFQGAADDAPPPSFDVDDVAAASRRATARHRLRVATVTSITAVVLAGAGFVAATSPFSDLGAGDTVAGAGGYEASQNAGQPDQQDMRLENGDSRDPHAPSKQGGGENAGEADKPGITSTSGCDEVDRRLATALAGELPVVPDGDPIPGWLCSNGGNAAFRVTDGDLTGMIMVAQLPGRSTVPTSVGRKTAMATARTSSGGVVVVASVAFGESSQAPFAPDVQRIADAIAANR
ncbi:MAG: hypothetical protein GEV04_05375 [Actinophytocola sp.]|nr:hypothetical protein [Actinophytocola sp.]